MPHPYSENTSLNQRTAALTFIFLMATLLAAMLYKVSTDTAVHWISDHGEAVWIHTGFPPDLGSTQESDRLSMYRRQFDVNSVPDSAPMKVEVFYDLRVDINDTLVLNFDDNLVHQQGKNTQAVLDTAPFLKPGENTIRIIVKNILGPHVLRVECPTLNLYSDPEWQYGSGPDAWDSAVPAIDPVRVEIDLGEQSEGKTS